MALINCPHCGNQVSIHAKACPKCGLPPIINPFMAASAANCPVCKIGKLVKMDAGGRGRAFGQGNLLGAFMKTHQCNYCGHLV